MGNVPASYGTHLPEGTDSTWCFTTLRSQNIQRQKEGNLDQWFDPITRRVVSPKLYIQPKKNFGFTNPPFFGTSLIWFHPSKPWNSRFETWKNCLVSGLGERRLKTASVLLEWHPEISQVTLDRFGSVVLGVKKFPPDICGIVSSKYGQVESDL